MDEFFPVSIQRCRSYELSCVQAAVERSLEPWGGFSAFCRRGGRVLLKPNLLFGKPAETAITTHPVIVEAVARLALDCGAQVFLGDSPPLASASRNAQKCGISEVAERLGIQVLEFYQPTHTGWRQQQRTHGIATPAISRVLQEMDLIVNLPKLKSHQQLSITGAVKNLYGCVTGRRKAYWHFKCQSSIDTFAGMLLALYEKIAPGLTIVDAIVGMEGQGPGSGTPVNMGLILTGNDALAVDRTIAEVLNYENRDHFVLRKADEMGFPSADIQKIILHGLSLEEARIASFQFPELVPIGFSPLHLAKGILKYVWQRLPGNPFK